MKYKKTDPNEKKQPKVLQSEMDIFNLFPSPLGIYTFPEPVNKKELNIIESFEKSPNKGNLVTKSTAVFEKKGMERIAAFCEQTVNLHFIQTFAPKNPNLKLRITQSWANYTETDQWHHRHSHANSVLSGVFYVQTHEETDKIVFYRQNAPFSVTPKDFNSWNSTSWWWPTPPNTLLLFPSTLEHSVDVKQTTGTRISISFNTFFVGDIGEENDLTHLRLVEP